jgi:hypothetical protein
MANVKTKSEFKPANFHQLMQYANRLDWMLLIGGLTLSCVHGCLPSLNMIIFRGITEVLVNGQADYNNDQLDMSKFTKDMLLYVILYFGHGLLTFVIGYCSVCLLDAFLIKYDCLDCLFFNFMRTTSI